MVLNALEEEKLNACCERIALWLQSEIVSYSESYDLSKEFKEHLCILFQNSIKFSFFKSKEPQNSSREFRSFIERIGLPMEWFPTFHMNIDLRQEILVDVSKEGTTPNQGPLFTLKDFNVGRN